MSKKSHLTPPSLPFFQKLSLFFFHLLFIITPFIFTIVNEELFEFNKMLVVYSLTTLITACWLSLMFLQKKIIWQKTPFDWAMALFLGTQLLAVIFSIHPRTSIFGYYTRFHGGFLSSLCYVLLYYALLNLVPKKHLPKLLMTALIAAMGVGLYAIPEHFGYSPSCLMITGKFGVDCWIQDVQNRVFGTFGQPNWLAAYTITLIPISIVLSLKKQTKSSRGSYITAAALLFLTLLFTKSRSGFLGLMLGLAGLGAGLMVIFRTRLFKQLKPTLPVIIVLVVLAATFDTPFTPGMTQMAHINADQKTPPASTTAINRLEVGGTDSGEIRKIVWSGALKVWQRYPLFGSGVETFAYSYYQDRPVAHNLVSEWDFLYNKAHNEFLNFLATTGLVGLGGYLFFLGSIYIYGLKQIFSHQAKPDPVITDNKLFTLGWLSGITALSVSNFFGFSTVMVAVLLFLAPGFILLANQPDTDHSHPRPTQENSWLWLLLVWVACIYILASILRVWRADRSYAIGTAMIDTNKLNEGLYFLTEATRQSPREALFYDQLAYAYSQAALNQALSSDATSAARLAQSAIGYSETTLALNSRHLNFYKTQARIYIALAQIYPEMLARAGQALENALTLSPTDAKLMYNLALIQSSLNQHELSLQTLEKSVTYKPNYEAARFLLGQKYAALGRNDEAKAEFEYVLQNINPDNQEVKAELEKLN